MASISLVISGSSPASTSLTFTPVAPFSGSGTAIAFTAPVAAGVPVGVVTVAPSNWSGVLTLSGTQASSFSIVGTTLSTAVALAAGVDNVTITATP